MRSTAVRVHALGFSASTAIHCIATMSLSFDIEAKRTSDLRRSVSMIRAPSDGRY
jgi:hypothetical protein